jgi:sterol desaturase/sphingolipid hydroxylase (fatty acid hydroxylase superfamily)
MLPWIVGLGVGLMLVERLVPDRVLPEVKGWWWRVVLANVAQLAIVLLAGVSWDRWLARASVLPLGERGWAAPAQGLLGYFVATFVYYWWHRARHDVNFLWLACHQLHHSPQRIEAITSFYKHPVELVANSVLSAALSYGLLGLTPAGAAWVTFYSAASEFFYHLNVRTPRWLGYVIQRPEMHRIHHARGVHYGNFADLPLWDLLFGTFRNPATFDGLCGFKPEREARVASMLAFQNVNGPFVRKHRGERG